MRITAVPVLVLAMLASAAWAGSRPPTDLEKQREQMRRNEEAAFARLPELKGSYSMAQVCRIVHEKGRLAVKSELPDLAERPGQYRVKIDGFDGLAVVSFFGGRGKNVTSFNLRYVDFSDPGSAQTEVQVQSSPQYFSFSTSKQMLQNGYLNMQLMQGAMFHPSGSPSIQFSLNGYDRAAGRTNNVHGMAADFASLRRQLAQPIEQHLRPLLRKMHWESVMAADADWAWQVFADQWKAPPAAVGKVQTILPRLDSDEFRDRESALRELRAAGRDGALALYHMDRTKLTPQQSTAVDTVLAGYLPLTTAAARRLRGDRDFLLDCLYCEDRALREAALGRLEELSRSRFGFALDADSARRAEQVDLVRGMLAGTTRPSTAPATRPATGPATRPGTPPAKRAR